MTQAHKNLRIAVLGATGSVGRTILSLLDTLNVGVEEIFALGSSQSKGKQVSFGDQDLTVLATEDFNFKGIDWVLSATPVATARVILPRAMKEGARVIDKSSAFRMSPSVPLVIPEVNGDLLRDYPPLIASPNCVAIPLALTLAPFTKVTGLERLFVSTYQSVSGVGRRGMDELFSQTKSILMTQAPSHGVFEKQIAFNVIPQIGSIGNDGWSDEESKIREETRKILSLSEDLPISVTTVRVPVLIGHSIAVTAVFHDDISVGVARGLLKGAPGVIFVDRVEGVTTPLEATGEDVAFVSAVRQDDPRTLSFWVTCDNLRKGAALNAVQLLMMAEGMKTDKNFGE